jgi:N-acetylglucosamine kinase-like BadF-type ATPase
MTTALTHVIGVDIGGTKTRVLLAPIEGEVIRDVVIPTDSWRGALGDAGADAAGLARLLGEHVGAELARSAVAVGAHGCENTAQCNDLESALRRHLTAPVLVVNDSELIAPAMGARHAIGMVVGTGSIATARTGAGELVTAGGWGWILGDEGSAPALVRDAVRAVLGDLDAGNPADALGVALMRSFGVDDGDALALALTQASSAGQWGDSAPVVFAAADEGSALAELVVREAGGQLALLVDRLLRRGIRAAAVVAGGSVIENQPRLQDALRDALASTRPEVALSILDKPPVAGALALARGIASDTTHHPHQNGESGQ